VIADKLLRAEYDAEYRRLLDSRSGRSMSDRNGSTSACPCLPPRERTTGYVRTHFVANQNTSAIYNPRTEKEHDQTFVCRCACGQFVRLHCRSVRLCACAGLWIWLCARVLRSAFRRCRYRFRRLRERLAKIASLRPGFVDERVACRSSRIRLPRISLSIGGRLLTMGLGAVVLDAGGVFKLSGCLSYAPLL